VVCCDVSEEKAKQGKHQHKNRERDNPARKASHFSSLADRIGLDVAIRPIRIVRRNLYR
jgi:hypothetical protein